MNKVLVCNEKWCDGSPLVGFTNSFHNIFNSFSQCKPEYNFNTIHIDESQVIYGTHIDQILLNYCKNYKVDIIIFSLIGGSPMNPTHDCYKKLKESGIILCFIWHDTGPSWGLQTIAELGELADLHISWDFPTSPFHNAYPKQDNHLFLWTPEDKNLFYKPATKDIPVSFMGSLNGYRDRIGYLNVIHDKCPVRISGGQRQAKATPDQYAEIIRRSKIGINFSLSQTGVFYQAKGRIFEYTLSGGLLLENENPSTRAFFTPNVDYVEFTTPQDLLDKVLYYLSHEEERQKIADQGYKTVNEKWSTQRYWDIIFERIKIIQEKQ